MTIHKQNIQQNDHIGTRLHSELPSAYVRLTYDKNDRNA